MLQIPEFSRTGRIVFTISSPAFPLFRSQQRTHNCNTHKKLFFKKQHLFSVSVQGSTSIHSDSLQYTVTSKCSQNHFSSEKYKQYNHLSYISFKRVSMCNYICLPATVKVLETFMEAILSKSFQLFHCILKYVSSITNMPSHHC